MALTTFITVNLRFAVLNIRDIDIGSYLTNVEDMTGFVSRRK